MAYTLVIDQGTHASRALLFDSQGQLLEQQQQDIQLNRLDHQRIEQDADDILQSVRRLLARLDPQRLHQARCCAISCQRSTVVAWHKQSGKPLYPAISWQDRRGDQALEKLAEHSASITRISGLPLSAHYGASKMHWLLHHVNAVQQAEQDGQLCIGPLASFLLHQLLDDQPYAIDHSNAHRTQLFDIQRLDWSDELTRLFQVPQALLPTCRPLLHDYGTLADYPIPVTAVCGDQTAAFYGHGRMAAGTALINMGTGAFILSPIDRAITDSRLLCSIGISDQQQRQYLLEGTVNGAGAALSWAQQQLPVAQLYAKLPGWLQQATEPLPIFINSVGGLGSPWWNSAAEAYFINAQNAGTAAKYVAVIESIAFLLVNNIQAMQQTIELRKLYVSGGLSRLDGLCQYIADVSGLPVHRLLETEATGRGAAWLANHCPVHWPPAELEHRFSPTSRADLQRRYREFSAHLNGL